MEFEYNIIRFLQSNVTTGWLSFFQGVTMLGSFLGFFITLIILILKNKKLSFALIAAFAIGSLINHILKSIIGRARPFDTYSDIVNYGNESGYSMPSGHSLCVGIFATFLIFTLLTKSSDRWTKILGSTAVILVSLLVPLSRMVLGVHYFTDTLLGLVLGILFACAAIYINHLILKKIKFYKGKK